MALSREAYQAFEDIVGADNISNDDIVMDTYAFQNTAETQTPDMGKFMLRPEAVLLPGSTEEVQAIVKACNRLKIRYKAHSTGWGAFTVPHAPGILLDMRRMDRILEIDEKNMFAVIEPYVTAGVLQAEAMKAGLNTHMIGAGSTSSVLAQATSRQGAGPDSISMGYAGQNVLAMEWVTPTGDIVRTGSLGSGSGWFCGEGPGPSLRGIVRGYVGADGCLGVFTKCAVKLYPWPGPAVMDIEGTIPAYNSPLPDNFRVYTVSLPTWQAFAETYYKIYDAEIGYIMHRQFNLFGDDLVAAFLQIITSPDKTIDDLPELLEKDEIQKLTEEMKISFQIILAGKNVKDTEYQEKALREILAETGGHIVAELATPEMQRYVGLYLIKMCFKLYNWSFTGGYRGSFLHPGTPDWCIAYVPLAEELKRKEIAKGGIVDDGAGAFMGAGAAIGGGGHHYLEMFAFYDPHSPESIKAIKDYTAGWGKIRDEKQLGLGLGALHRFYKSEEEYEAGLRKAEQPACWDWQRKIKEAFDPNNVGDVSYPFVRERKK